MKGRSQIITIDYSYASQQEKGVFELLSFYTHSGALLHERLVPICSDRPYACHPRKNAVLVSNLGPNDFSRG